MEKSKKNNIKGNLFVLLGIMGIILYIILEFKNIKMGAGGFFMIIVSIFLIIEGRRIKKSKKSWLFNSEMWGKID